MAKGTDISRHNLAERAVSALLLIVTLPVLAVAVLVSVLSLRAWPFFSQERVGLEGEIFQLLKIRTLPRDVPEYLDKHQLDHGRIPAVCRLLRRTHIDELPQLALVLVGRMSLVGPRPEMAHLHQELAPEFRDLRTSMRPGCTGLWQISASREALIGSAPEYDSFYVEHRNPVLDLWIVARTVAMMLGSQREVTLPDVPRWALRQPAVHAVSSVEPGL